MAVVTYSVSSAEDNNVRVEIDYNDATNRLVAIRQVNHTSLPLGQPRAIKTRLTFLLPDGSQDLARQFPGTFLTPAQDPHVTDDGFYRSDAGETNQANIPAAVANQFPLTIVNLRGRNVVANINAETHFPEF